MEWHESRATGAKFASGVYPATDVHPAASVYPATGMYPATVVYPATGVNLATDANLVSDWCLAFVGYPGSFEWTDLHDSTWNPDAQEADKRVNSSGMSWSPIFLPSPPPLSSFRSPIRSPTCSIT